MTDVSKILAIHADFKHCGPDCHPRYTPEADWSHVDGPGCAKTRAMRNRAAELASCSPVACEPISQDGLYRIDDILAMTQRADKALIVDVAKQLRAEVGRLRNERDIATARAEQAEAERDQLRAWLAGIGGLPLLHQGDEIVLRYLDGTEHRLRIAEVKTAEPGSMEVSAEPATPHADLARLAAEQGVKPVTSIDQLTAAVEDRPSEAEFAAFMDAIRRGDDGRGDR